MLVVDDNEDVLTAIRLLLTGHVSSVQTATSPASLPTLMRENRCDVVLLDMNYERDASSGREGLEYLDRLLRMDADLAIIMITAYGDVELAVRAMKRGAVRLPPRAVGQRAPDRVRRCCCPSAPDRLEASGESMERAAIRSSAIRFPI